MRRVALPCALVLTLALTPAAATQPQASWALQQIRELAAAGVIGSNVARFHPERPLTRGELETLLAALLQTSPSAVAVPTQTVTMAGLDSRLVRALGLLDATRLFQRSARSAGIAPPARFGSEAVARLLGLRTNHPAAADDLELLPSETATRAEAAFSAARILGLPAGETQVVEDEAATFSLPTLTPWQRRILATAVRFIGYPYVWGGESERAESPFGLQPHGGFDCSGFVWRVYKLQPYAAEGALASMLQGRTTYAMSGEVSAAKRIDAENLEPADVLFFGARGRRSKPREVDHMGIYLGNGWFIHSSGYGVAIAPLDGWYATRFAWARRPLAEAGLSAR